VISGFSGFAYWYSFVLGVITCWFCAVVGVVCFCLRFVGCVSIYVVWTSLWVCVGLFWLVFAIVGCLGWFIYM